jgi:hypothetical protein
MAPPFVSQLRIRLKVAVRKKPVSIRLPIAHPHGPTFHLSGLNVCQMPSAAAEEGIDKSYRFRNPALIVRQKRDAAVCELPTILDNGLHICLSDILTAAYK